VNRGRLYLCELGEVLFKKAQEGKEEDFIIFRDHLDHCEKCHFEKETQ